MSGERPLDMSGGGVIAETLDGELLRSLDVSGSHEHTFVIHPDGQVSDIGFMGSNGGQLARGQEVGRISEYTFNYKGTHHQVMGADFNYLSHGQNIVNNNGFGKNSYKLIGNNCQNFTSQYFSGGN